MYSIASSLLLTIVFFSAFGGPEKKFGIIRAKGIVIEDSAGRDRILIGSPIPLSGDHVRTDTAMVRKYWGRMV
jgi:hypothetical protein